MNKEEKIRFEIIADNNKVAITKNDQVIGYVANNRSDDFPYLDSRSEENSKWVAKNNSSEDIFEYILLSNNEGRVIPKPSYAGYEINKPYGFEGLKNFWFIIENFKKVYGNSDSIHVYTIKFGEGPEENISWLNKDFEYNNSPDGNGSIVDSPRKVIENRSWNQAYVVIFGIGRFYDNRVYKINAKAYAFWFEKEVIQSFNPT